MCVFFDFSTLHDTTDCVQLGHKGYLSNIAHRQDKWIGLEPLLNITPPGENYDKQVRGQTKGIRRDIKCSLFIRLYLLPYWPNIKTRYIGL